MKKLVLLLALLGVSRVATAEESMKVRKARMENDLEKEVDRVNEACGTKLTVSIDWGSFDAAAADWERKSISGYCDAPLSALRRFCEGAASKAYIKKNVETVTCHAAKSKKDWKATVQKGHIHWFVSPDAVNNDSYARTQLIKSL